MRNVSMYPKVIFASHHKCATKWFLQLFLHGCGQMGWKLANIDLAKNLPDGALAYCPEHQIDFLFFSNADFEKMRDVECPVVHVVRDPRDILVSGYFSHRDSHETHNWPELVPHRKRLQSLNVREGLELELDFSHPLLHCLGSWPDDEKPNILTLHYEEFSRKPLDFIQAVLEHLGCISETDAALGAVLRSSRYWLSRAARRSGLDLPECVKGKSLAADLWLGTAYRMRFSKLQKKGASTTSKTTHYRKGGWGQWRELLTTDLLEKFNDRYGYLVEKYGYPTVSTEGTIDPISVKQWS